MPLARVVGQFDQFQVCAFFSGIEPIRWLEGLFSILMRETGRWFGA